MKIINIIIKIKAPETYNIFNLDNFKDSFSIVIYFVSGEYLIRLKLL